MRFQRFEAIALFLVVCIGCNAGRSGSGQPAAGVELVREWRSTELGVGDSGTSCDACSYTFHDDGTFDVSVAMPPAAPEQFFGTYDVSDGQTLGLTIPEKGRHIFQYSLQGPVLTLRDAKEGSYVRLERVGVAAVSVRSVPSPPSAEQVADWAAFSKPVHLKREEMPARRSGYVGEPVFWGKPIWICGYSAENETLSSYAIALYKAGVLFGEHRAAMEQFVAKQCELDKEFAERNPERAKEMAQESWIETRPDGRKVYSGVLGFGPGGTGYCTFTAFGKYDLMLYYEAASEDVPPERRMKDPAEPTKALSDIFKDLENHIERSGD